LTFEGCCARFGGRRGFGGKSVDIGGGGRNFVGQVHFVLVKTFYGMRGHDSWRVRVSGVRGTGRYVGICAIFLVSNENVVTENVTVVHPRMIFRFPRWQTMRSDSVRASMKFYRRPCSGEVCVSFLVVQIWGCRGHFLSLKM